MRAGSRRDVGNLPAELTSFVGRRRELGEAKRLLSVARLVTLTGMGGVGKTRLALRTAGAVRRSFADGVWLVELADLGDPRLLPNTVATALGLPDTADSAERLAEYLGDQRLLLVLDNCEHVVSECAVLVAKILAAAAGVRVLATSRHALRVEGENILQVEPLPIPRTDAETGPYDAMRLFTERAAAVLPGFELAPEDRATVLRICQRLEGIPLAIELAAVRMRVLSADQLLWRLEDRFGLLTSGPRTGQPRQQTLKATLDWSFDLCSPEEQRLWVRLSVFPGGFDLETAEHVYVPGETGGAGVLDIVTGLVDKSVLNRQENTFGRHAWYRMLETVREYARAKLAEQGAEHDVQARQAEYYVGLARRFRNEGFGPAQLEWLGRLWREHTNIRAVLEFCLATRDGASRALEVAAALWPFWYGGGLVVEGYRYLRRGLDLCVERTIVRARALYAASFLALQLGEIESTWRMLAEHHTLAEEFDDELLRAGNAECAGITTFYAGDLPGGAELLERSVAGFSMIGDPLQMCNTRVVLAGVYFLLDDARGAAVAEEALALAERHQARWSQGYALWALAIHRWRAGDHGVATTLLRQAIALRLADRALLGFLLGVLAWCACSAGEHRRAAGLLGAANAVWRLNGPRVSQARPYRSYDEQCAVSSRKALGDKGFEAAFAATAGFGIDEAIGYALGERPAKAPASRPAPDGLTRREREVAELVAHGMSNRDIAAALVISVRTVETHVENILVKLGFTSRTEVASWLAAHKRESP